MSKQKESKIMALFSFLYILAVCFLAFVCGALVLRYNLPGSGSLSKGFIAAEAYLAAWEEAESTKAISAKSRHQTEATKEAVITNPEVTWDKERSHSGYTLVSTAYLSFPYLVDMDGKIVYRWNLPVDKVWSPTGCTNPFMIAMHFVDRAYVFPNGDVLAQFADAAAPYGCGIMKVDKDSKLIWSFKDTVHHDMTMDEKGNIYTLVQKAIADPQPGFEDLSYPINADYIVKLSPDGKELDRISILEAFRDTPYAMLVFHEPLKTNDEWDFMHTNSIDVLEPAIADKFPMFKPGYMLLSLRNINFLVMLDPASKKIVWAGSGPWKAQHSASFLANGNILLFDNKGQFAGKKTYSRVVEFNPATLQTTWVYTGSEKQPLYSDMVGRVQRLPNGNTLVAESYKARIFELTPDQKIVWSYKLKKESEEKENEFLEGIFTAYRYSSEDLPFLANVKKEGTEPAKEQK
jgi:hypothetical protein